MSSADQVPSIYNVPDDPSRVADEDFLAFPDLDREWLEGQQDGAFEAARDAGMFDDKPSPVDPLSSFACALSAKAKEFQIGTVGHDEFFAAAAEAQDAVSTLDRLWNRYGAELRTLTYGGNLLEDCKAISKPLDLKAEVLAIHNDHLKRMRG